MSEKIEPDTSEPVTYTGAASQAQDDSSKASAQEPPSPSEHSSTEGEAGKYKQGKKKSIVSRLPGHEPYAGHPKTKLGNPRDGGVGRGDEGPSKSKS